MTTSTTIAGVDLGRLESWMDDAGVGAGPIADAVPIRGGTQNVLVSFRRGAEEYVLRHPPLHKRASSDEAMVREARVLGALRGTRVPHAELIASCPDPGVLGGAFFLMAPVEGFNPAAGLPEPLASDYDAKYELGLAMVDGLVALSAIDIDGPELAGFGRREVWLERQPARWTKQLDSYAELPGCEPGMLAGAAAIAAWLEAERPAEWTPGLVHGDFHFANVLVAPEGARLAAIVDWELATIADPLLDLAHLFATWPHAGDGAITDRPDARGLPPLSHLLDHYAEHTGRDVADFGWFRVLACYRLAVLLEGTHARACAGKAPREVGDVLHAKAAALMRQANHLKGSGDA